MRSLRARRERRCRRQRVRIAALAVALPLAATPAAGQVAEGDVLVTSLATGLVYRLDPSAPAPMAPVVVPTGPAFVRPRGLALDRDGLLLVTDDFPKTLVRANPETDERGLAAQFSVVSSALRGVVSTSDGRVFVANPGIVPIVEPPLQPLRGLTYFPQIDEVGVVDGVTQVRTVGGCVSPDPDTGLAKCGNLFLPTGIAIESEDPELALLVADIGDPATPPPGRVRQGVIRVFPDRPLDPPPIPDALELDPPYPAVSGMVGDHEYFVNDELFCAYDVTPFTTPRSLAIDRSPGREGTVLVTDSGDGALGEPPTVWRVPATGCQAGEMVEPVVRGQGLVTPIGIAVADDGTIFVADATADTVFRIDPDTPPADPQQGSGTLSPLSTPGSVDQAWDLQVVRRPYPGPYFVADAAVPALLAVDPAVPSRTTVSSGGALVAPSAFEVLPGAAGLLVADPVARAVIEAALSGAQTVASEAGRLAAPTSASREASGSYLVTDLGDAGAVPPLAPAVIRVDPTQASPGNQELVSEGELLAQPVAGAVDGAGFLIVADAGDGTMDHPPRVLRISPTPGLGPAGQAILYEDPDLIAPSALALDEAGAVILLTDRGDATHASRVLRLVREAGVPPYAVDFGVLLATGGAGELLQTPSGIALDTDRSLLVADQGDAGAQPPIAPGVIRVDSLSGLQSRVAIGAAGETLELPTGIGVRAPEPGALPDQDGDGIADLEDNCISVANTDQRDTDDDDIGNVCDPDYNNDSTVANSDFLAIRKAFGASVGDPAYDEDLDADGDGTIGNAEFLLVRSCFGTTPGVSGLLGQNPDLAYCKPPQSTP